MLYLYVVGDCFEDIIKLEFVYDNFVCDREVVLYGYLYGCNLKYG